MEARIKVENGNQDGVWPAYWMMGENMGKIDEGVRVNWPYCGEIDIMEHANSNNYVQSRRFCTRRRVSSKQRYSVVPPAVFNSHIGSPFAIRTHRSSTHHDLPIFDAPPRMHNPCGSSVSTQNFVGGSFMSIKVSPSITVSFVFFVSHTEISL